MWDTLILINDIYASRPVEDGVTLETMIDHLALDEGIPISKYGNCFLAFGYLEAMLKPMPNQRHNQRWEINGRQVNALCFTFDPSRLLSPIVRSRQLLIWPYGAAESDRHRRSPSTK